MQRVRDLVARWRGRGGRGGARRHSEGSRGRRWPRRYGGAAAAALGLERERERKRGRVRERVRERSGLRGVVRGVAREAGEEAGGGQGKQEVAEQGGGGVRGGVAVSVLLAGRSWRGSPARRARSCFGARGGRRRRGCSGGLGRPAAVLGRLGYQVSAR